MFCVQSFPILCRVPILLPTPSLALLCSWLTWPFPMFLGATPTPTVSWLFPQWLATNPKSTLLFSLLGRRRNLLKLYPLTPSPWNAIRVLPYYHFCHLPSCVLPDIVDFGKLTSPVQPSCVSCCTINFEDMACASPKTKWGNWTGFGQHSVTIGISKSVVLQVRTRFWQAETELRNAFPITRWEASTQTYSWPETCWHEGHHLQLR